MNLLYNPSFENVNPYNCLQNNNTRSIFLTMTLGKKLKWARKSAGMTQRQLAQLSGVKQQMISKLETGKSKETSAIVPLALALGITPEDLYLGHEKLKKQKIVAVDDDSYYLATLIAQAPKAKIEAILFLLGIKAPELGKIKGVENAPEPPLKERRHCPDRRQKIERVNFERRQQARRTGDFILNELGNEDPRKETERKKEKITVND